MPDQTTPFDIDAEIDTHATPAMTRPPLPAGLTRQQLQAAASVLAHFHSRPRMVMPVSGSGSGASPN